MAGHTQEVCGLKWSPDGSYLASGGNDNLLNIWPADPGRYISQAQPLYTLTHHQAAVKVKRFILNFLLKIKCSIQVATSPFINIIMIIIITIKVICSKLGQKNPVDVVSYIVI